MNEGEGEYIVIQVPQTLTNFSKFYHNLIEFVEQMCIHDFLTFYRGFKWFCI